MGGIFSTFTLILQSHCVFAYNDPNHRRGYNACYTIGYRDGYNDAQNGVSPAFACRVIVKTGALVTTMDFAGGMVVAIFSMDKART